MFVLGYWAHGNTSIFFNKTSMRAHDHDIEDPLHPLIDPNNFINQTLLIVIAGGVYFVGTVVKDRGIEAYALICKCCGRKAVTKDFESKDDHLEKIKDEHVNLDINQFW